MISHPDNKSERNNYIRMKEQHDLDPILIMPKLIREAESLGALEASVTFDYNSDWQLKISAVRKRGLK